MARTNPPPDDEPDADVVEPTGAFAEVDTGSYDVTTSGTADGPVKCRWLSPQPVITGHPGPAEIAAGVTGRAVVCYGDPIWLTVEQADDPNTPAERWTDDWSPDPDVAASAPNLPKD